MRNDFFKPLLDSKKIAAFLRIGKHFQKLIHPHDFYEKRVCKVGNPCLFTFRLGELHVGRASFKARDISHFLVTRLRAVWKPYEATLNVILLGLSTSCSRFPKKLPEFSQKVAQKLLEKSQKSLFVTKVAKKLLKKNKNVFFFSSFGRVTLTFLSIFVQFCIVTSVAK